MIPSVLFSTLPVGTVWDVDDTGVLVGSKVHILCNKEHVTCRLLEVRGHREHLSGHRCLESNPLVRGFSSIVALIQNRSLCFTVGSLG
jgi:hypothetical protein